MDVQFVVLCVLWYFSSAASSNTGKTILTQFPFPLTLTLVQFTFVALYSSALLLPRARFRPPTRAIILTTLPMGLFQVGGHVFSSLAIARIPVATVHTIKALSPLFTVLAYRLLFRVRHPAHTYAALAPLTLGVVLACSADANAGNSRAGLASALASALVFVSSNIFFKRVAAHADLGTGRARSLDKLNLLFYASAAAGLLMLPLWAAYDLPRLLPSPHVVHPPHRGSPALLLPLLLNAAAHFAQNILAFLILARCSPVAYSIASLVKRVAVILLAFLYFHQRVRPLQALGIALTVLGLWMYNRAGRPPAIPAGTDLLDTKQEDLLPLAYRRSKGSIVDSYPSPPPEPDALR